MDLSTATTDELIEALMSRHDVAVFIGRPKANRDFQLQVRCIGPNHESAGLAFLAAHSIASKATAPETLR